MIKMRRESVVEQRLKNPNIKSLGAKGFTKVIPSMRWTSKSDLSKS
jgi:hypothetical protein